MADEKSKKRSLMIGRQRQAAQDEQDRQRQEAHKALWDQIKVFQESGNIHEKAQAAQAVLAAINDTEVPEQTRTGLSAFSQSLNLEGFMGIYKPMQELKMVGEAAYAEAKGEPPPGRSLAELAQDDTLYEGARTAALKFNYYLPLSKEFDAECTERQKTLTIRDEDFAFEQILPTGEKLERGIGGKRGTKVHVTDPATRQILLKPNQGDDPRFISMIGKDFESFLMPTQPAPEREASLASRLADMRHGERSSQLTKDLTNDLLDRARAIDPKRVEKLIKDGDRGFKEYQKREQERMKREQKRKEKERKKGPRFHDR